MYHRDAAFVDAVVTDNVTARGLADGYQGVSADDASVDIVDGSGAEPSLQPLVYEVVDGEHHRTVVVTRIERIVICRMNDVVTAARHYAPVEETVDFTIELAVVGHVAQRQMCAALPELAKIHVLARPHSKHGLDIIRQMVDKLDYVARDAADGLAREDGAVVKYFHSQIYI